MNIPLVARKKRNNSTSIVVNFFYTFVVLFVIASCKQSLNYFFLKTLFSALTFKVVFGSRCCTKG